MDIVPVSASSSNRSVVTQSNCLTESRYTLTVSEQRLVLTLISFISPKDEDFKDYEIKISDFKKILDIKSNTVYSKVQNILIKLGSRVINIPKKNGGYLITHWFSSAEYEPNNGSIKISFDKKLKPYLLQLKEQFTQYRLFTVAQFQSSYTVRVYMLLKQYEKIGFREIELKDLRYILDIEDGKYSQFKEFKRNVLNQAKKEFEKKDKNGHVKSDITFDLETIRTGRKITRLRFIIRKQKYQESLPLFFPEAEPITPAIKSLTEHKISETLARKFQEEQGEEEIIRCIAKYEDKLKAGKVEDTDGGYLLRMLEGRAGKRSKVEEAAEEKARKKAEAEAQRLAEEKRKEEQERVKKQAISRFLKNCDEGRTLEITKEFEASDIFAKNLKVSPFLYELYKNTGVKDMTIKSMFHRFIYEHFIQ